ncbi:predicted protein [Nematostella vectensis]|uniref:Uncharacterized protein n=1 Tax=Nematostella vectensis TaxID=45351 RepID=A7T4I7_NEMVE|nr:predicted protein [Nematostella vectensis]|eukprot:XP_001621223.1 hypothetical protein NEMVEDRAFT_v1g222226 [Nematostella vectensis]
MEVSKTIEVKGGKNYREKVGEVEVTTPTLEDIAQMVVGAKVKEKDEEGLPVYETEEANWIFGAMVAAIKAGARNKLQPGSVELKGDTPIPTDWAGIVATGERGGAAALAIHKECKQAWATYVAKLGKSENTAATLVLYFNNKQALMAQPAENRQKMAKYVEEFAMGLSEEDQDRFTKPITSVLETCNEGIAAGNDF